MTAGAANAGVANIGFESTVQSGHDDLGATCIKANQPFDYGDGSHGVQCVAFTGQVIALSGTLDLKPIIGVDASSEALSILWCNVGGQATQVWRGENWANEPIHLDLSNLMGANIMGPCWMEVQTGGYFTGSPAISGYEATLTIYTNR